METSLFQWEEIIWKQGNSHTWGQVSAMVGKCALGERIAAESPVPTSLG